MKVYDILKKYYYATPCEIKFCDNEKGEIEDLTKTMFDIKFKSCKGKVSYKGEVANVPYNMCHRTAVGYQYYSELLEILVE